MHCSTAWSTGQRRQGGELSKLISSAQLAEAVQFEIWYSSTRISSSFSAVADGNSIQLRVAAYHFLCVEFRLINSQCHSHVISFSATVAAAGYCRNGWKSITTHMSKLLCESQPHTPHTTHNNTPAKSKIRVCLTSSQLCANNLWFSACMRIESGWKKS